jgi:prepilin-type N-terminal cleavage/methylation domain-containing protein/prepilin-type processing-associated H-X9-DG protein
MIRRGKGFTLIELLVVIAIIAILAAMLFPVFARARESARKIQCLANVKNIATAVQMYLVDYDRFPPSEHRQEVWDWLINDLGEGECTCHSWIQNPYLRWMVIFEEYVKNRDVWRCPSARSAPTYMINPCIPDWLTAAKRGPNECTTATYALAFPPGWGGTITDSYVQRGVCAGPDTGGMEIGIGVASWHSMDEKTSQIKNPSRKVVCADGNVQIELARCSWVAYPDTCRLDGAACDTGPCADWENCSWTLDCGAGDRRFGTDPQYRKEHARARHLGGSNIGFADGHAAWMPAEEILFGGDEAHGFGRTAAPLEGLEICGAFVAPFP